MDIKDLLDEVEHRTHKSSKRFYKPFSSEESEKLRAHYASKINNDLGGSESVQIINKIGTRISVGYNRVVIGDYGAYIEIRPDQIEQDSIKSKWSTPPRRPVKYIWMETRDREKTKVYWQQGRVAYADYVPGMYYMSVSDAFTSVG